jgi:hypothetical protein
MSFHVNEKPAIRHQTPMLNKYPYPDSLKIATDVVEEALDDKSSKLTDFHRKMLELKRDMTPPIFYKLFDVSCFRSIRFFLFQVRPIDPLRWTLRSRYPKEHSPIHCSYIKCNGLIGESVLKLTNSSYQVLTKLIIV